MKVKISMREMAKLLEDKNVYISKSHLHRKLKEMIYKGIISPKRFVGKNTHYQFDYADVCRVADYLMDNKI